MSKVAESKTLLTYAKKDLNRINPLADINPDSQSDLDSSVATH